jgi:hypothetical protein
VLPVLNISPKLPNSKTTTTKGNTMFIVKRSDDTIELLDIEDIVELDATVIESLDLQAGDEIHETVLKGEIQEALSFVAEDEE